MKISQPKVDPTIQDLVSKGYLLPNADGSYRLTEKGQAYMDEQHLRDPILILCE